MALFVLGEPWYVTAGVVLVNEAIVGRQLTPSSFLSPAKKVFCVATNVCEPSLWCVLECGVVGAPG